MIDRARRFAGGRGAVAAAFALHIVLLVWFVWRARGDERLYWEYGGRVLGRRYTAGFTDWVQHRTGDFPPIELAAIHTPYIAPYSGFACEYPPGALWLFAAIRALAEEIGAFSTLFHGAMALCCIGCAWLCWRLVAARASQRASTGALVLIALWPLLTGPMAVMRFDPLAALLAAGAIVLAARGHGAGAGFLAGLGAAVKIWPGLIVPFLCAMLWRSGRRGAGIVTGLAAITGLALPHLGMIALGAAPQEVLGYLGYLRDRPPEVESLTANLIAIVARATGADIAAAFDFGSFNLDYAGAEGWTAAASLVNLALLLALFAAVWFTRDRHEPPASAWPRLAAASGAAVCATIVCSRVFSSEYLIWLLPFAILAARSPGGPLAILCYAGALISLKIFYRFPEWPMGLSTRVIAFSLLRNLLVLGMGAALAVPLWRRPLNSRGGGAMFGARHNRIDPSP